MFGEGADGGGRRRLEDEHNDAGAAGAAVFGAVNVLRVAGEEEGAEGEEGEAIHPGLQAGVRAFLHPRGWEGGAGRVAEESPTQ